MAGLFTPPARADGDPASDFLLSQTVFVPADANVSAQQQARLSALVRAAGRAGFPIRVAIIPNAYDLGSITALWLKPGTYARFLGIELSLAYKRPLLVVMPNGFGVNWPGHSPAPEYRLLRKIPVRAVGGGLIAGAEAAVLVLASADGVKIAVPLARRADVAPGRGHGSGGAPAIVGVAVGVFALAALVVVLFLRRRRRAGSKVVSEPAIRDGGGWPISLRWAVPGVAVVGCVAVGAPILVAGEVRHSGATVTTALPPVPTPYTWGAGERPAPAFRLTDQNGHPVSLAAYRGRPVIVTFIDPLCRNLCPLAAQVLNQVDRQLPSSQRPVIVAVSVDIYADGRANLLEDFRKWRLVPQWRWAVGQPRQLASVWDRYQIGVSVATKRIAGVTVHFITHDEVAFVIDRAGYERALFGWPYYPEDVEAALKELART